MMTCKTWKPVLFLLDQCDRKTIAVKTHKQQTNKQNTSAIIVVGLTHLLSQSIADGPPAASLPMPDKASLFPGSRY